MGSEQLAKRGLVMEDADHLDLAHPHDFTFGHRPGRRQAQRLANQAAFAEEFTLAEDGDHGFLALVGLDHDLDSAFLHVEDRVRGVRLCEDDGVLGVLGNCAPMIDGGEKHLCIKGRLGPLCHGCVVRWYCRSSACRARANVMHGQDERQASESQPCRSRMTLPLTLSPRAGHWLFNIEQPETRRRAGRRLCQPECRRRD